MALLLGLAGETMYTAGTGITVELEDGDTLVGIARRAKQETA